MKQIFSSATKIVFIAVAFGMIGLTFLGRIEAKDYVVLTTTVFLFYYNKERSQVGSDNNNVTNDSE